MEGGDPKEGGDKDDQVIQPEVAQDMDNQINTTWNLNYISIEPILLIKRYTEQCFKWNTYIR